MTVGRVVPVLNIIKDRSTNMYRVLITDDEKIEREGIKFLLAQEEGEYEIHEAANGRQALNVLRSEEIDFLSVWSWLARSEKSIPIFQL